MQWQWSRTRTAKVSKGLATKDANEPKGTNYWIWAKAIQAKPRPPRLTNWLRSSAQLRWARTLFPPERKPLLDRSCYRAEQGWDQRRSRWRRRQGKRTSAYIENRVWPFFLPEMNWWRWRKSQDRARFATATATRWREAWRRM